MSPTLEELDGEDWGPPTSHSHLVKTCHLLRKKPLEDFNIEDMRIMIGQNIGLDHLMPRAVVALEKNPLAEGDYYPGDLLHAVTSVKSTYYRQNPQLVKSVLAVCRQADTQLSDTKHELSDQLVLELQACVSRFFNQWCE